MKAKRFNGYLASFSVCAFAALPLPALAYIGPGAGLSAIGTILALLGAVLLALFGFIWYPVKRLMAKRRSDSSAAKDSTSHSAK
jgi:O-antigen ligase